MTSSSTKIFPEPGPGNVRSPLRPRRPHPGPTGSILLRKTALPDGITGFHPAELFHRTGSRKNGLTALYKIIYARRPRFVPMESAERAKLSGLAPVVGKRRYLGVHAQVRNEVSYPFIGMAPAKIRTEIDTESTVQFVHLHAGNNGVNPCRQ